MTAPSTRSVPAPLRFAVWLLPRDVRDEVLRELLEQHARRRQQRGRLRAAMWAYRQPLAALAVRDRSDREPWLAGLTEDVARSQRLLRRRAGLAATVTATIGISVGAIAAIVSVIDAVLLRPLPFPDAARLVWLSTYEVSASAAPFSPAGAASAYSNPLDVVEWGRRARTLAAITPYETFESTVVAGGRPLRVDVASVGTDVGQTLRIRALHGRLFTDRDADAGVRALVLSHRLWQSALGGAPSIVGQPLSLAGTAYQVIGILPPLPVSFPTDETDIWVPLRRLEPTFSNRGGVWQRVVARVDDEVTVAAAQADLDRVVADLAREYPDSNGRRRIALVPFRIGLVGTTRDVLALLGTAVALVLLIACANVGHLLLVNAQGRQRELALRLALGASPRRLARLLFAESAWLAAAGGVAGLVIAPWMLRGFLHLYPDTLPAVGAVGISVAALVAALAATLIAALLGVVPAILNTARARAVTPAMGTGHRGTDHRTQRRLRGALVVVQVALSTVLLLASGLLLQTFWSLRHTNTGFAAGNVLTFNVALSDVRYPALADEVRFYDTVLDQIRAMPGVVSAGMTTLLPLTPGEFGDGFYRVGEDDRYPNIPIARLQNVTPGYLDAIGLPLKAGRTLRPSDRAGAPPVVVVNETLQRRFFPDGAVGRQIRFRNVVTDVVGVVGDKQHRSLREVPRADMYFPRAQVAHPRYLGWVAIRVEDDPMTVVTPVRHAIARLDAEVAIDDVDTMANRVEMAVAADRFRATLIGALGLVALVLAALGLYGVVAHAVGRDARDIAVRLALGAGAGRTVARVLRSVLVLTAAGIASGFAVAWSAQALVAGFLSGVTPFDPVTVAAVVTTLVLAAAAAAFGPAARAARLDPATILKSQ